MRRSWRCATRSSALGFRSHSVARSRWRITRNHRATMRRRYPNVFVEAGRFARGREGARRARDHCDKCRTAHSRPRRAGSIAVGDHADRPLLRVRRVPLPRCERFASYRSARVTRFQCWRPRISSCAKRSSIAAKTGSTSSRCCLLTSGELDLEDVRRWLIAIVGIGDARMPNASSKPSARCWARRRCSRPGRGRGWPGRSGRSRRARTPGVRRSPRGRRRRCRAGPGR